MNNKGFAASGILYTILLIFLGIMMMSLFNFESKKNILDTMKNDIKGEVFDYESAHTYMDGSGASYPELYTGMIPVKYDKKGNTVVANLKDKWYDYSDHEWANAVLVKNKVINSYDKYSDSNKVHGATLSEGYVSFDGVDDYIDLGLENYDFGKTISYAVRFKAKTTNTTDAIIGNWEGAGGGIYISKDGILAFNLYSQNDGYKYLYDDESLDVNKIYTVVCVADGQNLKMYINGKFKKSIAFTGNIKSSKVPIALGINVNDGGFVEAGNVDIYQTAIFDRALTSDEIEKGFKNDINVVNDSDLLIYDDFSNHKYKGYEKIQDDEILQYYVWIPRYRYKLFNAVAGESAPEQMIEIEFEHKNITKSVESTNGLWLTHPAFTFGNTELNGFWVGKFEPSHSDTGTYINQSTANKLNCSNENCEAASGLIIKPNQVSIVNNNIANFFYVARSIENSPIFGLNPNKVDTHMMKNMEWGAVAYLSASKYGLYKDNNTCNNSDDNRVVSINGVNENRCELWLNNTHTGIYNNENSGINKVGGGITGCSAMHSWSDGIHDSMVDCGGKEYEWNGTINNGRSSTTGNIYGIYDLAGGANEYMMGSQSSSSNEYIWNPTNSGFVSQPDDKYMDKYLASKYASSEEEEGLDHSRGYLGDATRETMKTYGEFYGSWFDDYAFFTINSQSWFRRGGYAQDNVWLGNFTYGRQSGSAHVSDTFRVVLSAEDTSS